jgi:PAS domain S-box-containing protein
MSDYFAIFDIATVGDLAFDGRPAWLWAGEGTRVVWCNRAGGTFLRASSMTAARRRRIAGHSLAARELARYAKQHQDGHNSIVLLRFQFGVRSHGLTCHCRRVSLADGTAGVLAVALIKAEPGEPRDMAESLAQFIDDQSGGFALFSGAHILANPSNVDDARVRQALSAPDFVGRKDTVTIAGETATLLSWSDPLPPAPGAKPTVIRFVWRMDADTRLTLASEDLQPALGVPSADLIGLTWPQIQSRYTVDPQNIVAAALAGRDSWGGLTIAWPIEAGARQVPIDLSALPTFDADRNFMGFRGFGMCRPAEVVSVEDAPTPPTDVTPDHTPPDVPLDDVPPDDVTPADTAEAANPTNVVPLRGHNTIDHEQLPGLSAQEREAFRQIGETLGTELAADVSAPGEPREPSKSAPGSTSGKRPLKPSALATQIPSAFAPGSPKFDLRLVDRLPVGVLICRQNEILFANETLLALLGYTTGDQLRNNGGLNSVFADPSDVLNSPDGDTTFDNRPSDSRIAMRCQNGATVDVKARMYRVPWNGGSALMITVERERASAGFTSPGTDLDAVAVANAARDAAQDRAKELEAILETATDGVVVMTASGKILSINHSAEALFGRDRIDIVGSNISEFLALESRQIVHDYIDGLANYGVASVLNDGREIIGQTGQGGLLPLFMTIGRVGAEDNPKFCAVLRDITQWKRAEEDLTSAKLDAETASSQKSDFLARISHEIRTPLNAIIGFSEVMMEQRFGPVGNDRYREYLQDIHTSGSHIMSLINDLLDLAKIEAGKMELAFEAVGIADIINECVGLMQPQANRDRVIIRTSLSSDVPRVVADERSIRQIVLNLLSNAIKFNVDGGQVIISAVLEGSGEVALRVRDTGIGMAEMDVATALEPFRQLQTPRAGSTGSGLGLPLTKALVEANRAAFTIESTLNQGTLVEILFPATRVLAE